MRRSGKTTRTIDAAIQDLFKGKTLYFPSRDRVIQDAKQSEESRRRINVFSSLFEGETSRKAIIDDGVEHGYAQEFLLKQFLRRLSLEHSMSFTGKIHQPGNGVTILSLKDFKKP